MKQSLVDKLKKYILQIPFVKAELVNAFRLAHKDILETMKDDLDDKAEILANKKLSEMMSPIDWNSVISFNKAQGAVYIGKVRATPQELLNLKSEAELLKNSRLYSLLLQTPNALAQNEMFVSGASSENFMKGRAMIYHLDSQKNVIDILCAYKPPPKDSLSTP